MKKDKIVIGVRPALKMFRISSVSGLIIDNILEQRGNKLPNEYYREISRASDGGLELKNDDLGNRLSIDLSNIIFTKDFYNQDSNPSNTSIISEFNIIWEIINKELYVDNIRRIGCVFEHQINCNKSSIHLIDALTVFNSPDFADKFHLKYEEQRSDDGSQPDIKTSNFTNIIYEYYDGDIDIDHPNKNTLNANFDYQKYFNPTLKGAKLLHEVKDIINLADKEQTIFAKNLSEIGLFK